MCACFRCVFQDKKETRITLAYQVDVCVDGCVLMCVCVDVYVEGKGLKEKDMVCVCFHVWVRKRTFHVCVFQDKSITQITLVYQVDVCVLMGVC